LQKKRRVKIEIEIEIDRKIMEWGNWIESDEEFEWNIHIENRGRYRFDDQLLLETIHWKSWPAMVDRSIDAECSKSEKLILWWENEMFLNFRVDHFIDSLSSLLRWLFSLPWEHWTCTIAIYCLYHDIPSLSQNNVIKNWFYHFCHQLCLEFHIESFALNFVTFWTQSIHFWSILWKMDSFVQTNVIWNFFGCSEFSQILNECFPWFLFCF
jgi:hypothetical protein